MCEAEILQFSQLIEKILGNDNQIRKASEETLNQIKDSKPNEFILVYLKLLKESSKDEIRSFCAVGLRKNLSSFSESNYTNLWPLLTAETQLFIKNELFQILASEAKSSIRHLICDAIGELGGCLLEYDNDPKNNQWPELTGLVMQLLASPNNVFIESGMKILGNLFQVSSEVFIPFKNDFLFIFKNGLASADKAIQIATLQAVGYYLDILESKDNKPFQELLPAMLAITENLLLTDSLLGEEALAVLSDIAESEAKFFKSSFKLLFESMNRISLCKKIDEESLKRNALEVLVEVIERVPSTIKKSQETLLVLLQTVFHHMMNIEEEITPEWEKPKEGFDENFDEDADYEIVRHGMSCIDRLTRCLGEKVMIPILSQLISQLLQQSDWRAPHAALMALSQVGEHISDVKELTPIVTLVLSYLNNPSSKVRFAVAHFLGQLSDDMNPDFQEQFHVTILPVLIQAVMDPVPRVSSHLLAALTNFIEGLDQSVLSDELITMVLEKAFQITQTGVSLQKENAIAVVSAIIEVSKEKICPYYQVYYNILVNLMISHTADVYKQLRGEIVESLSLLASAVGWAVFAPNAPVVINMMMEIQEKNLEEVDPQKSYLISSWQRLCITMGKEFAVYLPRILPSLLKVIKNIFDYLERMEKDLDAIEKKEKDEKAGVKPNNYFSEETEVAVNLLSVLISENKEFFSDNYKEIMELIIPLVNYKPDEKIKIAAAKCLPLILEAIKFKSPELAKQQIKLIVEVLFAAINQEYDAEVLTSQIYSLKDCFEIVERCLDGPESQLVSERIIKLLLESDKRKDQNDKFKKEEDVEEQEREYIEEDIDLEEDLQVGIAELIGMLFKTQKELMIPLMELICEKLLPQVLQKGVSDKMHKFGLFLVVDMIEFLGPQYCGNRWDFLSQSLFSFVCHPTCFVRQAASYGVGILAQTSGDYFSKLAEQALVNLIQATKIADNGAKPKVYGHCQDNVISSIGKIIKYQGDKINLQATINEWLGHLPLKYDKPEALIQHELLVDILLSKPELIFSVGLENYAKVLSVFAKILNTKTCNAEIKVKIQTVLKQMQADPNVVNNYALLIKGIDEEGLKKLQSL